MKSQTVIAKTSKGHRVFLENLSSVGWIAGAPYSVTYEPTRIVLRLDHDNGKRKVVASKGGVIDLEGKRVTAWAQGATVARIALTASGRIIISKGE